MKLVCSVVGARPNFMKMAPVVAEMRRRGMPQVFVHTGQHYDRQMSDVFLEELGLPSPDVSLGVGSGSQAVQTGRILMAFEDVCLQKQPSLVVVAGDVNSTLACALAASKLHIPVAHVEAGLRSFDRAMPEEINRVLTDHLADLHFCTESSGVDNLMAEGISSERVFLVGNCMVDSLWSHLEKAVSRRPWERFGYREGNFGLVTLHRPSNVDDEETLQEIARALAELSQEMPLLFPAHPRTLDRIKHSHLSFGATVLVEPMGYLEFLGLMARARLVLTDSGGIQEETTALGIPCITLRNNTERPVTVKMGTNRLVGTSREGIVSAGLAAWKRNGGSCSTPELWDGKTAGRIVDVIERWFTNKCRYTAGLASAPYEREHELRSFGARV
jgi:UDP-N-acetylglucosamine 2-epimerase (non-hydrolysing)